MNLIPENWENFQHYRDRNPLWIKLHKNLLDDRKFQSLPVAARALAPMLWLIASESAEGIFNGDISDLAFRLRDKEKNIAVSLDTLIKAGLFLVVQPASNLLAEPEQVDSLEKRREETEKETEKRREESPVGFVVPDWINSDHWDVWHQCKKRKNATDGQKQLSVDKLAAWRDQGFDYAGALENAAAGGYQGLFLPDKPRVNPGGETAYQRSMREKYEQITPSIAAKAPGSRTQNPNQFFDTLPTVKPLEISNV